MTGTRFPLAPMSRSIRIVTGILLAIPPAFAALSLAVAAPLAVPAAMLAALYAAVWLTARPTAFELDASALRVRFPLWTRSLPTQSLADARVVEGAALRGELGLALRVGVGGLWGGFGWLWSSKRGWVELYVSQTDRLLWIERRAGLPLLISPDRPSELAERLRSAPA